MKNRDALVLFGLLGLGLFVIIMTRKQPVQEYAPGGVIHLRPLRVSSESSEPESTRPRYRNKEIRNIEWNSDGLPVRIEITRDYSIR